MIKFTCALFILLVLSPVSAFKYLHRGPPPGSARGSTILKGHTMTNPLPSLSGRGARTRRLVDFNVELKKDAIVWDELEEDGARLQSCTRNSDTKKATMTVKGPEIDPEDFEVGAAFVISAGDWEAFCSPPEEVEGIDPADDALFYTITSAATVAGSVVVSMDITAGAEIAPVVEIEVREEPVAPTIMPRRVMWGAQFLPSVHMAQSDNLDLSTSARPTIKHKTRLTLFKGAKLGIDASLSTGVEKFRITRFFKTEVQWEQFLNARVVATLEVEAKLKKTKSGEIMRRTIPKFGFSAHIPFVGDLDVGALIRLDWVASLEVSVGFRSRMEVSYRRREKVTARIIPPSYDARNMLPGGSGTDGTSSLVFNDETKTEAKVTGFAGVRPAVGLIVSLGRKGVEGNIGAKVGLQMITRIKSPPFGPYTGTDLKLGKCGQCHVARAGLSLKGKDLTAQLRVNGRIKKEAVLLDKLFTVHIGTLCAVPSACGAGVTKLCGKCSGSSQCDTGLRCRDKRCQRAVPVGADCSLCKFCPRGARCIPTKSPFIFTQRTCESV